MGVGFYFKMLPYPHVILAKKKKCLVTVKSNNNNILFPLLKLTSVTFTWKCKWPPPSCYKMAIKQKIVYVEFKYFF